jgi:hypothetical protein
VHLLLAGQEFLDGARSASLAPRWK